MYGERSARHEGDVAGMIAAGPALSWDDGDPLVFNVVRHCEERGTRKELWGSSFDEQRSTVFLHYLTGQREGWIASAMALAKTLRS